tara:strand:- start:224 stop:427 length:204 start_codon:yes stop_codon:yes gene_type:complete
MNESKEVPISHSLNKNYKTTSNDKPVSVKELRSKLQSLEKLIMIMHEGIKDTQMELTAIIEEIGEEW